jgi:hypothetical protein
VDREGGEGREGVSVTDEQVEKICLAIKTTFRFQNADIFEHVFGGFEDERGLAAGVHRVADALDRIAEAIEDK